MLKDSSQRTAQLKLWLTLISLVLSARAYGQASPKPASLTKPLRPDLCSAAQLNAKQHKSTKEQEQRLTRYDAKHEATLYQRTRNAKQRATMLGEGWQETPRGLSPAAAPQPTADAAQRQALALKLGDTSADTFIRAIFSVDKTLDLALAIGLEPTATPAPPTGYGLELRGHSARLVRYDRGAVVALSPSEVIYKLEKRAKLEALIWRLGPHLLAQLHDAKSGVELLNLYAYDTSYTGTGVGLYSPAEHQNPAASALEQLSHRAACHDTPKPNAKASKPPRVFATLLKAHAPIKGMRLLEHDAKHHTFEATGLELEQLSCASKAALSQAQLTTEIPWKYVDDDLLAYREQPPLIQGKRVRLDTSYKTPQLVQSLLEAIHQRHPKRTRLERIGTSHQGRPIMALAIANALREDDPRPTILFNAAHHGDEPLSTEITFDIIDYLLQSHAPDEEVKRWLDTFVIWVVPQVNPDGANAFIEQSWRAGRKNGRDLDGDGLRQLAEGVDLNRNYPIRWGQLEGASSPEHDHPHYRGHQPASEPETQAMMRFIEREHFAASISYHTGTVCILAPYTIDLMRQPEPNEAWAISAQIASQLPITQEGRTFKVRKNIYAVDGTDQDWMRHQLGTVAILVEAVRHTPRTTCARRGAVLSNRGTWQELLRHSVNGPSITGTISDLQGTPLKATITLDEQRTFEQERWTSRERDGRFMRYLIAPGTYTLRVQAPGFAPYATKLKVSKGMRELDIKLTPDTAP